MVQGIVDHVRHSRAREEVHTERDRLLKQAGKSEKTKSKTLTQDTSKDRARAMVFSAILTFPGMIGYVVILMTWFFVYHESLSHTIAVFILLLAVCAGLCSFSDRKALGRNRLWLWWGAALAAQAALVAFVLGFFLYFRLLCYYWKYAEMRTYTNVAAAQDPAAFIDGSMILFTEDTHIDPMRAVGFKSRWTGQTYCVAPIVDSTMSTGDDIKYWAVGEECCPPRGGFSCDDAEDFSTRTALVVLEPEDVVRPFMKWAVKGSSYHHFKDAIAMQESTYFTRAASHTQFVYWTKDPIVLKESFFKKAKDNCTVFSLVYFLIFLTFSYFISWRLILKQQSASVPGNTNNI